MMDLISIQIKISFPILTNFPFSFVDLDYLTDRFIQLFPWLCREMIPVIPEDREERKVTKKLRLWDISCSDQVKHWFLVYLPPRIPDIDFFKSESILRNFILGFPPSVTSDFVKIFLLFIAEFGFDRKSLTSLHHTPAPSPRARDCCVPNVI